MEVIYFKKDLPRMKEIVSEYDGLILMNEQGQHFATWDQCSGFVNPEREWPSVIEWGDDLYLDSFIVTRQQEEGGFFVPVKRVFRDFDDWDWIPDHSIRIDTSRYWDAEANPEDEKSLEADSTLQPLYEVDSYPEHWEGRYVGIFY